MPWSQTSTMDQRTQFIADFLRETLNITELCDLYGVSRKTGYKWIGRCLRHMRIEDEYGRLKRHKV